MTQRNMSRRERRVLLLGVGLIGAILVGARGVPSLLEWRQEMRLAAAELVAEAARADASVRRLPATLDSLEQRKERFIALALLFVGVKTTAAAAGALASRVSYMARTAGVDMEAIHIESDTAITADVGRVSVRAEVVGDIRGITSLLLALERGPALVAVHELSISQPRPAAPSTQPETLQVQFRVAGLVLTGKKAEGE